MLYTLGYPQPSCVDLSGYYQENKSLLWTDF